jgi:hypothetical protein
MIFRFIPLRKFVPESPQSSSMRSLPLLDNACRGASISMAECVILAEIQFSLGIDVENYLPGCRFRCATEKNPD